MTLLFFTVKYDLLIMSKKKRDNNFHLIYFLPVKYGILIIVD